MLEHFKNCVLGQFEAALWMLHDCMQKCPVDKWSGPGSIIGKYEFWMVAYHVIMFVDLYLSPGKDAFQLSPKFHPAGWSEFDEEYPSRLMRREELIEYLMFALEKLRRTMAAETEKTLTGPSRFERQKFSRAELHLYSMRHVMHHTGQLSAFLRKLDLPEGQQPKWGFTGWKAGP